METGKLTWEELIFLSSIRTCGLCGHEHAPVRSCHEAEEALLHEQSSLSESYSTDIVS